MKLALGIIGAGSIGTVHALTAMRLGVRTPGVWDIDPARGTALARRIPGLRAVAGLDELLGDTAVNAVVIATPNDMHAEIACRALGAGKHVLLEKPMATSVAECDRIIAALGRSRCQLQMGFVYRHAPAARALLAELHAGRLGRIYHTKCSMYRRRGIPGLGGWFTTKSRSGGGPLIDLGVHVIDQALMFSGYPAARRASGRCYATFGPRMRDYVFKDMWAGPPHYEGVFDVEDHATALVRLDDGLTIEVNVAWASNLVDGALPEGITLFGERGGCRFTLLGDELVIATERNRALVEIEVPFDADRALDRAFDAQLESFRQVVEEGEDPSATALHGRAVQAVIEAIYRSSEEGREVEVAQPVVS